MESHRDPTKGLLLALRLLISVILLLCVAADVVTVVHNLVYDHALDSPFLSGQTRAAELRLAQRMRPDLADAWRLRAELLAQDRPHDARKASLKAVQLQPTNWENWDQLALLELQFGNIAKANQDFQQGERYDRGYSAHYEMASFARILGETSQFKDEMRAALEMVPQSEIVTALTQALAGLPSSRALLTILPENRPEVISTAAVLLAKRKQMALATDLWMRMNCPQYRWADCQSSASLLVQALLNDASSSATGDRGEIATAQKIWNRARQQDGLPVASSVTGKISDPNFTHSFLGGFSWSLETSLPMERVLEPATGQKYLAFHLEDNLSSQLGLIRQAVLVIPGKRYCIQYDSRADRPSPPGLAVDVLGSAQKLLGRIHAKLTTNWVNNSKCLSIPRGTNLILVDVQYNRPLGYDTLRSTVELRGLNLTAATTEVPLAQKDSDAP